ncbi:hypothetical protein [Blastococcus brunescens]|uniref:Uncharacterized protein n=1 Tax=Blastococcus brunescens TaxID=1564165 RepID=A0ABZ1AWU0_9ACTN|nr:hypothetical protein [Blastococcus sp. BMG 8361]WRL62924.1 hypothetical protein U6N30_24125 [Blastococcus sp. BMG 8361]
MTAAMSTGAAWLLAVRRQFQRRVVAYPAAALVVLAVSVITILLRRGIPRN